MCFVTHGGYNSLLESAQAGVPMVMVPLFADQYGNVVRAQRLNLGTVVFKEHLSDGHSLIDAVKHILDRKMSVYSILPHP